MSEWQDISTAPKDGTRFWVPSEDGALEVQWHEGFGCFVSSWRRMEFAKGYSWTPKDGSDDVMGKYSDGTVWRYHSPERVEPKFWMPRPQDPPK